MAKVYFPGYKGFKCLAGSCPMNCCKVFRISFFNWEAEQFGRRADWNDIDGNGHDIREFLEKDDSGWYCKSRDGACTFFDHGCSLCGVQLRHGAGSMPSVCRTYPRIITRYDDRAEYGLDPCCPVVAHMMHDWKIGELICEEGLWEPRDEAALRRRDALALLADADVPLQECLVRLKEMYSVSAAVPHVGVSGKTLDYARRFLAFMLWSYLLPYDGIGIFENMMALILDIIACYLEHVEGKSFESDWDMSMDLSQFLLEYVERVHFDVEIEGRYVDAKE